MPNTALGDRNTYWRLVWFHDKYSLAQTSTKDLPRWSPYKLSHFLYFTSAWFSTLAVYIKHSWMKCSFTVNSCSACQLCASENPLQSLFWLVWGGKWLPRVLWEVNVHGLHSGILGVMTEEVPEGERLFAAISLSLFLTTRLPQQMAPMLTQRHCEAMKNCVGWYNTTMCRESKTQLVRINVKLTKWDLNSQQWAECVSLASSCLLLNERK